MGEPHIDGPHQRGFTAGAKIVEFGEPGGGNLGLVESRIVEFGEQFDLLVLKANAVTGAKSVSAFQESAGVTFLRILYYFTKK